MSGDIGPRGCPTQSSFIAEFLQELHSRSRVRLSFDTSGGHAIDHAKNPAPLFGLNDDYFDRIRARTINVHHLGNRLNPVKDINRESVSQGDDEDMTRRNGRRVLDGVLFERFVISIEAGETLSRGLVESNSELEVGRSVDDRLVNVFHGFDEVALPDNDVAVFGNGKANSF